MPAWRNVLAQTLFVELCYLGLLNGLPCSLLSRTPPPLKPHRIASHRPNGSIAKCISVPPVPVMSSDVSLLIIPAIVVQTCVGFGMLLAYRWLKEARNQSSCVTLIRRATVRASKYTHEITAACWLVNFFYSRYS